MKTIRHIAVITILLTGTALSLDFPVVESPQSSDGISIVTVKSNEPVQLPPWLAGVYLNKEQLLVVGNMGKLPFDETYFKVSTYNRYGVLLQQSSTYETNKNEDNYWMEIITFSRFPITSILKNTKANIPDDFQTISWIEISFSGSKAIVRRVVVPQGQK